LTDRDIEIWEEDPVEFIHKRVDPPMDDYKNPIASTEELLIKIVSSRKKESFLPIVGWVNNIFAQYAAMVPKNFKIKDGALKMMSVIAEYAMYDDSPVKDHLEEFLVAQVLPECLSTNKFLRIRACDTLLSYGEIEFSHIEHVNAIFQSILTNLKDVELPVRIQAALALSPFLEKPSVHEAMRPHVIGIMQELLNLTNEIDIDTLTHVMETLVSDFADDLAPFAVQLATQLTHTFMGVAPGLAGDDLDTEESENKIMIAMGILKTLSTLVLAVEKSPAILQELELVYAPVLEFIYLKEIIDLYEDAFEIIDAFTYCSKFISPTMWAMFDYMYAAFKKDAYDYLENIAPVLINYIVYDANHFLTNPQRLEKLMEIIRIGIDPTMDLQKSDRVHSCRLIESMLLHMRGNINNVSFWGYISDQSH
jgi:hypothetical protein